MKHKKLYVLSVVIILFVLVTSVYRYWETPIDKSYDCILVYNGKIRNVKVEIKGIVYSSLIQMNRIRYKLMIDDFEAPLSIHSGKVLDFEHYKTYISDEEIRSNLQPLINQEIKNEAFNNAKFSYCEIEYRYIADNDLMPKSIDFGELYFDDINLNNIAISFDGSGDLPEGYIVSEVDVKSAKEMIFNQFGFNWKL